MSAIAKRLEERPGPNWRQCYKAMQVADNLISHGAERFVDDIRMHRRLLEVLTR